LKTFQSWRAFGETRRQQYLRAALVGLLAGGVALAFQYALEVAESTRMRLLESLHLAAPGWGWLVLALIAATIGAAVGWATTRFAPEAAGSGIPHVKGVLLHVSTLNWRRVLPVKFIGGVLAIGAGFSLGREGPTVQMGAAVGRLVSDLLKVPAKAAPRLMACGAGAGLAAAFHAPLAGFIFTIEELQREFSSLTYAMALIAAVVADIVATSMLGHGNVFNAAGFPAAPLGALPVCMLLGLVAGTCGAAFNRSLLALQKWSHRRSDWPAWKRAGLIGFVVGLAVWWLPEIVGGGQHLGERILHGDFASAASFQVLLLIFAGKFALTLLCYLAGVPGGIFAPMMVMGACLGLLCGIVSYEVLPQVAPNPASFAAIGMAAFFAAVVRAPLTGVVLVLEMTGDYNQLLPVLTGAMMAYMVAEHLGIRPIYEALLAADVSRSQPDIPAHRAPVLLEFVVEEDSAMDGKAIKDIPLPERCLFVTVTRNGDEMLPGGGTELRSGDHVTAVLSGADASSSVARVLFLSKV
jgi:CIC family chloride channel protein